MNEITVNILGGTTFRYDDDYEAFRAEVDFAGETVDVNLTFDPNKEELLPQKVALLEKIYRNPEKWLETWKASIKKDLLPKLEGNPNMRRITPVLFEQEYALDNISIIKYEGKDLQIDAIFEEIEPEFKNDVFSIGVAWSLKNGCLDFYVDGMFLDDFLQEKVLLKLFPPKKKAFRLQCGEIAEYDFETDVYYAVVDMADQEVGCYFSLDEDGKFPKKSIALFEKVYEKADAFDDMAIRFLIPRMTEKIRDIQKKMGEPDLTMDKLLSEIALDAAVFNNDGTLEFAYLYMGETYDLRIAAQGSYAMGFTKALFEVEEQ